MFSQTSIKTRDQLFLNSMAAIQWKWKNSTLQILIDIQSSISRSFLRSISLSFSILEWVLGWFHPISSSDLTSLLFTKALTRHGCLVDRGIYKRGAFTSNAYFRGPFKGYEAFIREQASTRSFTVNKHKKMMKMIFLWLRLRGS